MTTKNETVVAAPVSKYAAKRMKITIAGTNPDSENSPVKDNKKVDGKPSSSFNYPKHVVNLALIIKNNAEIRRFTSLGILNYLLQKGEIKGKSRFVTFKYNKFTVTCDGLMRDYLYTETFFINALIAAFSSFSASAQKTIDIFCKEEINNGLVDVASKEDIETIITLNENHSNKNDNDDELRL